LRKAFGMGKPRGAHGASGLVLFAHFATSWLSRLQVARIGHTKAHWQIKSLATLTINFTKRKPVMEGFSTGC